MRVAPSLVVMVTATVAGGRHVSDLPDPLRRGSGAGQLGRRTPVRDWAVSRAHDQGYVKNEGTATRPAAAADSRLSQARRAPPKPRGRTWWTSTRLRRTTAAGLTATVRTRKHAAAWRSVASTARLRSCGRSTVSGCSAARCWSSGARRSGARRRRPNPRRRSRCRRSRGHRSRRPRTRAGSLPSSPIAGDLRQSRPV